MCSVLSQEAANLSQVVVAVTAVLGLILVVIGWFISKRYQLDTSRHTNLLTAMREYQSLLQLRYEDMLTAIAPLITATQLYEYSLKHPEENIIRSAKAMHEDAKNLEKGFLPYYFALQANCYFDADTVNSHANQIQETAHQIRTVAGYYIADEDAELPKGAVEFLVKQVNKLVEDTYYFMLNLNQEMKSKIEGGPTRKIEKLEEVL